MRLALLLLTLGVCAAAPSVAQPSPGPVDTSIVRLLAAPEAVDGRWVRVIGFLDLAPEDPRLYLHREDLEHGLSTNGVPIRDARGLVARREQLDRRYVLLEARFSAGRGLIEIQRCMLWSGFAGPARDPDHRPCAPSARAVHE